MYENGNETKTLFGLKCINIRLVFCSRFKFLQIKDKKLAPLKIYSAACFRQMMTRVFKSEKKQCIDLPLIDVYEN